MLLFYRLCSPDRTNGISHLAPAHDRRGPLGHDSNESSGFKNDSCNAEIAGEAVGSSESGFESDYNEVVLALRTGENIALPRASKRELADRIFDEILKLRLALLAAHGH